MPQRRNVVVINSDSFRRDNLTAYGGTEAITPNLDALAGRSVVFEEAYCGSYPTLPNRTDVFLGTWTFPNSHWEPLARDEPCLAGVLSDAGISTFFELDCPHMVNEGRHYERGFKVWRWVRGQEIDAVAPPSLVKQMELDGEIGKIRAPAIKTQIHIANRRYLKIVNEQDYFMAQVARHAVDDLEFIEPGEQFFMWVDMFDPHEPFDAPRRYFDLYYPGYKGPIYANPIYGRSNVYSKSELRAIRAAYLGEATMVDHWIGYLLTSLKSMGLEENTVVIFTSDHGLNTGDHGWTGKNCSPFYSNIARVPLFISTPETRAKGRPSRVSLAVQPVDLMPTILDVMGVRRPRQWRGEGVSLAPLLEGKSIQTRDVAVTGMYPGVWGADERYTPLRVSTKEWALIFPRDFQDLSVRPMLFNQIDDPGENVNLISRNMKTATQLYEQYREFYQAYSKTGGTPPVRPPDSFL